MLRNEPHRPPAGRATSQTARRAVRRGDRRAARRRGPRRIACLAALLSLAAACDSADPAARRAEVAGPAGEPIVIGMDEDSSGPGASYGVPAGRTVRDAVRDINRRGGVLGRPLKLVVENDASDPTKTPSIVRKLLGEGAKAVILSTGGGSVLQAKPVLQGARVPAFAPVAISEGAVTPPNADYVFMLGNPISDFTKVYCAAMKQAGYRRLGVMTDLSPTIVALNRILLPKLRACVDVVGVEQAELGSSDVTPQVARLKRHDPDAVFVSSVGGIYEILIQNKLAEQMPGLARYSLASIGNQPGFWKVANPRALDGLAFMGALVPGNPRAEALRGFLTRERGGRFEMTAYDAQAWDSVQLIKTAIERARSLDGNRLKQELEKLRGYRPAFGQSRLTLSFAPGKHIGADGLCGLALVEFGRGNRPGGMQHGYQPQCG